MRAIKPATVALGVVLLAGALVRLLFFWVNRPGFIGYPDSGAYLLDAFAANGPFYDPLRIVGYGVFIDVMYRLSPNLSAVTAVQHAVGLTTAAMLYVLLRTLGVRSRWAAVVPATVVALGGAQIMFEHAILTESLWQGLMVASLLCVALGAAHGRRLRIRVGLLALGGLAFGVAATIRLPGLLIAPVVLGWVLVAGGPSVRSRAAGVAALIVSALAPLYGFASWHEHETGRFGLTRNGVVNLYGRVAPWADCTKFTPPKGSEFLCEDRPVDQRPGHDAYIFSSSPLTVAYGLGGLTGVLPEDGSRTVSAWSRAAIRGQPDDYAWAVLRESRRLVASSAHPTPSELARGGHGFGPDAYPNVLQETGRDVYVLPLIGERYGPGAVQFLRGGWSWFGPYERATRLPAVVMALAIVLAALAPFVTRGPERRAAWLLSPVALVLLVGPVATSMYDFRYVAPVLGLLAAAAAVGGWGVAVSTQRWWRVQRAVRFQRLGP